jgi:prepilin-type N-terminal cleavage/methylation domain-containing protein
MRMAPSPARRASFTLIELLVVISILAILVGLTMAGISRVRSSQLRSSSETLVKKLQVGINQQLTASFDESTKRGNPYIGALQQLIGDNDDDRAKSLLCYVSSKRTFPMNFAEANLSIVAGIPPHRAFAQIPAATGLSLDQQAAVLLYIIVHDMSGRGTTLDADAALASAETVVVDPSNNKPYKVYKDAYGTHIAFLRWYGANATDLRFQELQSPPYVNVKDVFRDPYDRLGKLKANPWPAPNLRSAVLMGLNNQATIKLNNFDGLNKVVTVISAGPDKTFGTDDDVYGFPLAQIGAKGD